ncbi:MAG: hypothetical protein IKB42_04735 [Clostridia bacterium]|nr:hypothetical protein [Clostridia bacterium]
MIDKERLLFEHSILSLQLYNYLSKIDFSNNTVNSAAVASAKRVFDTILKSKNCEIRKSLPDIDMANDGPRELNIYEIYMRVYSDLFDNVNMVFKRKELYSHIDTAVYNICTTITELLNEYSGTDENLVNLAQNAVMMLKGRFINSALTIMKDSISGKADLYTHIPADFGNSADQIYALVESTVVHKSPEKTCVNTIYTIDQIKELVGLFNSALLSENDANNLNNKEAYSIYTPHNTWVHTDRSGFKYVDHHFNTGFAKTIQDKSNIIQFTLPKAIKEQKMSVGNTLKGNYSEATFFAEKLYTKMMYPQYYGSVVGNQNNIEQETVAISSQSAEVDNVSKPKVEVGKVFGKIGMWLLLILQGIGKFFVKLGLSLWKGVVAVVKVVSYPFVVLYKLCVRKPVVAVILGLVVVAIPIACFFILRDPCCYDYGKVVVESTCTTHGKAEYRCVEHNKVKSVELPFKHNVVNNKCTLCGGGFATDAQDAYSQEYNGKSVYFVNSVYDNQAKRKKDDHTIIAPSIEDGIVEQVWLEYWATSVEVYLPSTVTSFVATRTEIKNITIYSQNADLVVDLDDCETKNLYIVGEVKTITNVDDVDNIVVYGTLDKVIVEEFEDLDKFVVTGGLKDIVAEEYGRTLYISDGMTITNSMKLDDDIESVYVSRTHTTLTADDGVVYTKDLSQMVFYPKNSREKTLELPDRFTDTESLVQLLDGVENLRTIEYPDGLKIVHLNYLASTKIKNVEISENVKEIYIGDIRGLKSVEIDDSIAFEIYRKNGAEYTEKQPGIWRPTDNSKQNAEYLKNLGFTAKLVRV